MTRAHMRSLTTHASSALHHAGATLRRLCYPALCPLCRVAPLPDPDPAAPPGQPAAPPAGLCRDCTAALPRYPAPHCQTCGVTLPNAILLSCDECLHAGRRWRFGTAAWRYEGIARQLVQDFKYNGQLSLSPALGAAIVHAWRHHLPSRDQDLVIPVPLHWYKAIRRGYNQSDHLARAIAAATPLTLSHALRRVRHTQPQARLSRAARLANLAAAFAIPPHLNRTIIGRRILLVDDVLTTGSTLQVCSRVLLRAGAASVDILALARG